MKISLLFAFLPALAFATKGMTVPVPKDPQGRSPAITRSMVMKDGTWIVADTAHRIWWSRDVGTHWDSVATSPNGSPVEVFGETVWNGSESHVWTFDAGWRTIDYPKVCGAGRSSSISSGGVIGIIDSAGANVSFCQSSDGLRTWVFWMSIPVSSLPEGITDLTGDRWNDKIWYPVVDSGYVRGTADGRTWTRIDLPPLMTSFTFMPLTSNGSELVIHGGETSRKMVRVAISTDLGNTWDVHSASEPGWLVRKMSGNLFSTMTFDTLQGRGYGISRSRSGPWTMLDTAFRGNLVQGDDPYVVEEHVIYKLILDGVGRRFKPAASEWSVRREQGILVVNLPSSLQTGAWTVRALCGRKLASGRVAGERIDIPLAMAGALLTIGEQTRMLPRF